MRPSDPVPTSRAEWIVGAVAVSFFAVLVGWRALSGHANAVETRPAKDVVQGASLRADEPAAAPNSPDAGDVTATPPAPVDPPEEADDPTRAKPVPNELLSGFDSILPQPDYDEAGNPIPPKEPVKDPVPEKVRALSGRRVSVRGYVLPMDYLDGKCSSFILALGPPGCCFGCRMWPNNWIRVAVAGGRKVECADLAHPYSVEGVLTVNHLEHPETPLYTMDADLVEAAR